VLRPNFSIFDQNLGFAFDELIQLAVIVKEANHQIVSGQEGGGTNEASTDRIVVADNGVLDGVRKSEQDNQVEGVELDQFPFSGEAQHQDKKKVNDNGAENFLDDGQRNHKHVLPDVVHARTSEVGAIRKEGSTGEGEARVAGEGGACPEGQSCLDNSRFTRNYRQASFDLLWKRCSVLLVDQDCHPT